MKITIIGTGRLAYSLIPNLKNAGFDVLQLIGRSKEKVENYANIFHIPFFSTKIEELHIDTQVVILCVSDTSISEIAPFLAEKNKIIFHTSGSIDMEVLAAVGEDIGVLYPLQIFTTDKIVPLEEVPFFYQGKGKAVEIAKIIAEKLSHQSFLADSATRLKVHLGAVIACNFSNFLFRSAQEMLPENMSFNIYEALMREHIEKVFAFLPQNTQTGPAIRGDKTTIDKHLDLLENKPEMRDLYKQISHLINPDVI